MHARAAFCMRPHASNKLCLQCTKHHAKRFSTFPSSSLLSHSKLFSALFRLTSFISLMMIYHSVLVCLSPFDRCSFIFLQVSFVLLVLFSFQNWSLQIFHSADVVLRYFTASDQNSSDITGLPSFVPPRRTTSRVILLICMTISQFVLLMFEYWNLEIYIITLIWIGVILNFKIRLDRKQVVLLDVPSDQCCDRLKLIFSLVLFLGKSLSNNCWTSTGENSWSN